MAQLPLDRLSLLCLLENVYMALREYAVVVRIDPAGQLSLIAGNGVINTVAGASIASIFRMMTYPRRASLQKLKLTLTLSAASHTK